MLSNKDKKDLLNRFGKKFGVADLVYVRNGKGDHAIYDFLMVDGRVYRQPVDCGFRDAVRMEYLFKQARAGAV